MLQKINAKILMISSVSDTSLIKCFLKTTIINEWIKKKKRKEKEKENRKDLSFSFISSLSTPMCQGISRYCINCLLLKLEF